GGWAIWSKVILPISHIVATCRYDWENQISHPCTGAGASTLTAISWAFDRQPTDTKLGIGVAIIVVMMNLVGGLLALSGGRIGEAVQSLSGGPEGKKRSKQTPYGDAVLADDDRKDEMAKSSGAIIGQRTKDPTSDLLRYDVETGRLIFGGAGSGKDALADTEFLSSLNPIEVLDPQFEAFFIVSPARASAGRRQILLDPTGVVAAKITECGDKIPSLHDLAKPARCNPFMVIPNGIKMVETIKKLVMGLIPAPASTKEPHFIKQARIYFSAGVVWICCTRPREQWTIKAVIDFLSDVGTVADNEKPGSALESPAFKAWLANPKIGYGLTDFAVKNFARMGGRELGSVISTMNGELECFVYDTMVEHMSTSDFSVEDVVNGDVDIYAGVPASLVDEVGSGYGPYVRLFLTMLLVIAEERSLRSRTHLYINEGSVWGRIHAIEVAYKVMRKTGLSTTFVIQDFHSFEDAYGQKGAMGIVSSAEVVSFLGLQAVDVELGERIVKAIGKISAEVTTSSANKGGSRKLTEIVGTMSEGATTNTQIAAADLIPLEELVSMEYGEQISFIRFKNGRKRPLRCWSPRYFERPETKHRAAPNPYRLEERK
ncbi:MAG TPA: type IV secretory system conjugative DNA transfer family protein, partial [Telmatospirillum sp.]|nr:type IV secretory system conjugative DNA transfer family protein [Telmatospirillum sp.]